MGEGEKIAYSVTEAHAYLPSEEHPWRAEVMSAMKDKTIKRAQVLTCWAVGKGEPPVFEPTGVVACSSAAVKLVGGMGQLS